MTGKSIEGAGGLHIIVTGASSGLGEAMARSLAGGGHRVVLVARRAEAIERLRTEINPSGRRVIAAPGDVTDPADVERVLVRAHGAFGPVDVLINNAGVGGGGPRWWQRDPAEAMRVFDVNVLAAVRLTGLVLPEMLERRTGHIINIGSVAARVPAGGLYAASKSGLRGFSLALRRDLAGTGVSVSLVEPGFIRTPMTEGQTRVPMPGPEVVGRLMVDLVEHPRAEVVIPAWYRTIIWLANTFPGLADSYARRFRPQ
ncbi:MAG TPA: SDR family NAD(P)-dependent oxidoreductase [Deinococcales bacterium]|nr:SDR family NAD(P)-dependent oxidoreductase [Deinococcales bacterium]